MPPIRLRRRMTQADVEQMAGSVARILAAKADGPADDPATWIQAAQAIGAKVRGFYGQAGDGPGYYDGEQGTVFYNLRAPRDARARYLVHELAHHVLATWPGSRFPRRALERYDDDRQSVQHRVARRVEELVLDAPE